MQSDVNWARSFTTLAGRFGTHPAVVTPTSSINFATLVGRAAAVAALRERIAIDEAVATLLPNSVDAVVGSYGVFLSGAAETALNPISDFPKFNTVRASVWNSSHRDNQTIGGACPGRGLYTSDHGGPRRPNVSTGRVKPSHGLDRGKILFTSGTTGKPKAIIHSHERRWIANLLLKANLPFTPGPENRLLLMTPFSHGASLLTAAFHDYGASVHLLDGVDVDVVRDLLSSGSVDAMFAPPTVLAKLTAAFQGFTCSTVRAIFTGTATLPPALYRQVRTMFGPVVRITYGKTEIFNPITVLQPMETDAAYENSGEQSAANLGWPAAGVELDIRDDDGNTNPVGTPGRIFIRAPQTMVGYIDESGYHEVGLNSWHESGDIGYLGARGELMLCGRDHDMIKTGGYKMFPREVEAPIETAGPGCEVIALGLPSQYWGEILIVAAERPAEGWERRAEISLEGLSRHKKPRAYVAVTEFPRNAQGKIQRGKLVSQILTQYRIEDGPHPRLIPAQLAPTPYVLRRTPR